MEMPTWLGVDPGAGDESTAIIMERGTVTKVVHDLPQALTEADMQREFQERELVGLPPPKKACDNPLCDRQVTVGVMYCCAPCGQAHEGRYEIHDSGPLAHTVECDARAMADEELVEALAKIERRWMMAQKRFKWRFGAYALAMPAPTETQKAREKALHQEVLKRGLMSELEEGLRP